MRANAKNQVSSRVLTVPNLLSFFRLALVPVFLALVILGYDLLALAVLVFSSVTDFLDGVLARRLNQVSRLGQLLDPAADRLFIFAALIGLAARGIIPWWLVAIFGYGPLPVHHLGKIATFCLFYALPILMIGQAFPAAVPFSAPIGWGFALWGAFLYWWAGVIYFVEMMRVIKIPWTPTARGSDTLSG